MTDTITSNETIYALPTGLSIFEANGSVRCDDCNNWEYVGSRIHHSRRCDTSTLQAIAEAPRRTKSRTVVDAGRNGSVRAEGYSDQDIVDAVANGVISVSTAMNQDF